jgi:predicted amidophosphoribosyltransferase
MIWIAYILMLIVLLAIVPRRVIGILDTSLRRSRGLCSGCGYNLKGNTSGTCPECGAKVSN